MSASKVALPYPIHVGNGLPVRRNGTTESRGSAKVAAHEKRASGRPPECNARSYAAAPNDRTSTRIAPGTPFCECKASRPWATNRQPCSSYSLPARWYKVRLNPDTQYGVAFSSTAAAAKSNGKRGMLALYPGRPSGTGPRGCRPASWVTFTRKPPWRLPCERDPRCRPAAPRARSARPPRIQCEHPSLPVRLGRGRGRAERDAVLGVGIQSHLVPPRR